MLYELTHGRYSLDDLYDLLELDEVGRSHRDAAQANAEHRAAQPRQGGRFVR